MLADFVETFIYFHVFLFHQKFSWQPLYTHYFMLVISFILLSVAFSSILSNFIINSYTTYLSMESINIMCSLFLFKCQFSIPFLEHFLLYFPNLLLIHPLLTCQLNQ